MPGKGTPVAAAVVLVVAATAVLAPSALSRPQATASAADQPTLCRTIARNNAGTLNLVSFDKGAGDKWLEQPPPVIHLAETWKSEDPDGKSCRTHAVYTLSRDGCDAANPCLYSMDVALRRNPAKDRLVPDVNCTVNSPLISCNKLEQDFVKGTKLVVQFSLCTQGVSCTKP